MTHRLARVLMPAVLAIAAVLAVAPPPAQAAYAWQGTSASARAEFAKRLVANVNATRKNRGLAAVTVQTCVDNFSADWAGVLDRTDTFKHVDLSRLMSRCNLSYASENLARWTSGYSPAQIHRMWMNSDAHRHNILSRYPRRVGITVVWDSSRKRFLAVMQFARMS